MCNGPASSVEKLQKLNRRHVIQHEENNYTVGAKQKMKNDECKAPNQSSSVVSLWITVHRYGISKQLTGIMGRKQP